MEISEYLSLKNKVLSSHYSWEIDLILNCLDTNQFDDLGFFKQYLWVVLNAGIRNQVAVIIYHRVLFALLYDKPIDVAFKNRKKTDSIMYLWKNRTEIFTKYLMSTEKIEFLNSLPFIGEATKFHLARNLGINCFKPDRHILRIAKMHNISPENLCSSLARNSNDPVGVVDVVLWRAANLGFI